MGGSRLSNAWFPRGGWWVFGSDRFDVSTHQRAYKSSRGLESFFGREFTLRRGSKMSLPSIAVINFASTLNDQAAQEAIRAVNRQVTEDFVPIWGYGRLLRLQTVDFNPADPETLSPQKVPADSAMYLVDEASLPGALGFHDLNTRDVPVGFVFVLDPNDWTVTLSHEVLELILDPTVNIFVPGPDPRNANNIVLHTYEACDAVERISYTIDGIAVSDFLTPSYFTIGDAPGTRNDFLGVGVSSFGVTQNSHIAFFDLSTGTFETVFGQQAPAMAAAKKQKAYDRLKSKRPLDEQLQVVLNGYRAKKLKPNFSGLPQMRAITRTGRYKAGAESLVAR